MEGKSVVPMEITFMDNGGNIFVLDEAIEHRTDEFIYMNLYM
jgi:hypothetical protein